LSKLCGRIYLDINRRWFYIANCFWILLILSLCASAQDDRCLLFYGFENETDTPTAAYSIGWHPDTESYEGIGSYSSSNDLTSNMLILKEEGPSEISFQWRQSEQNSGHGLFLFYIDGSQEICKSTIWSPFTKTVTSNGTHELKWVVSKGKKPFTGWIDALCIRKLPCSRPCSRKLPSNQAANTIIQTPKLRSLTPDKPSPQEMGSTVAWNVDAFDSNGNIILYKFYLDDKPITEWTNDNTWIWTTNESCLGNRKISVCIRDELSSNLNICDDRMAFNFTITNSNLSSQNENVIENETQNETIAGIEHGLCTRIVCSCEELQNAINNSECIDKRIFLRSGFYNGTIYIINNTHFLQIMRHPQNRGSVIFDAAGSDFNIAIEDSSNILISGLVLKNAVNGIGMDNVTNCTISDNEIAGFKMMGAYINNSHFNNSIRNNSIYSNIYINNICGINLINSSDILIDNNDINSSAVHDRYIFIDILLKNCCGNSLHFMGNGIIIENDLICSVSCTGRYSPACKCDSCIDNCQHFRELSQNSWSFAC